MAQKGGTVSVLDIILAGDTVLFHRATTAAERALLKLEDKFGSAAKAATLFSVAAGATGAALFVIAKSAADTSDELGKMAQKVGVSVEALSGLKYAGQLADVSLDSLGTGLKQLSKNMLDAQANTGDAKDAFRALKINVEASAGQLRLTEDVLLDLADKFAAMEDGAGKTALAMRIFGKSGADMIPLLNQGRAGIAAASEEAKRFGLVVTNEAAKAAEQFNDNLTRLGGVAQGVKLHIGNALIPSIIGLQEEMLEGIKIAGGFGQALLQFGTINPFRNAGGNIRALGEQLDELRTNRGLLDGLKGYEGAISSIDREIQVIENRIKFLKFMQQREALALGGAGAEDQNDRRLRSAGTPKTKAPELQTDAQRNEIRKREDEIATIRLQVAKENEARELAQIEKGNKDQADAEAKFQQQQIELRERLRNHELEMGQATAERRLLLKSFEFKTDEELEIEAHEKRLAQLSIFKDEELAMIGGRQAVIEQMEQEHQNKILEIRGRGLTTLASFNKASWQQQTKTIVGELMNMTDGVAQHSKTLFQINKIAGIANAIISAHEGIALTMAKYPYPLNIAMAAAHGVAAFAQVNAIRNASFGGGGGTAPSLAGSTPAQPVTPVAGGSQASRPGQTILIRGVNPNDLFTGRQVRRLYEQFSAEDLNGSRLVFQ